VALQYLYLVPTDDPEVVYPRQRKVYRRLLGGDRSIEHSEQHWLFGTVSEIQETIATYERQGFDELILHPVTNTPGTLENQLELWRDRFLSTYQ